MGKAIWLVALALGAEDWEAHAHRLRGLPPEFAADLFLRVAERDNERRAERIEEAFRLGSRAVDLYPTMGGWHTDTRAFRTASKFELDALSLRMRAVRAMLAVNPERAAAMFRESPIPVLPVLTCQDAHIPVFETYYETLRQVYEKGFSRKQRERGEPGHMLRAAIAGLQSPAQVEPLGKVLFKVAKTPDERQEWMDAYGGAVGRLAPSDRAFGRHTRSLLGIIYEARRAGVNPAELIQGFGRYIAADLSGPRCSPYLKDGDELGREFNALAGEWAIPAERMRAGRDAGKWDDGEFWESARAKEVMADLRWLTHGNRDLPGNSRFWTEEERKSLAWSARYQEFQKRIEGWKESEEADPVDAFWMQGHSYWVAADLVPEPAAKAQAVRRWLTHLEQGYRAGASQNVWFGFLTAVMRSDKRTLVLQEMLGSRNAVIAAYAQWLFVTQEKVTR